jgi:hypothetical protein
MVSLPVAITRIGVALAQGLALTWLYEAHEAKHWPATDALLFAPLVVVAVLIPLLIIAGLGNLRGRTLAIWAVAATVLAVGLAINDVWRNPGALDQIRNLPSAGLWLALGAAFFILHSLSVAGDADGRFIATYPRHFDISWKQALQVLLAGLFVAVFWGLLWLGVELFRLIQIELLADLVKRRWFSVPVTTIAFAAAIHITDVRTGIISGTRNLVLTLLSWLLPMMACSHSASSSHFPSPASSRCGARGARPAFSLPPAPP